MKIKRVELNNFKRFTHLIVEDIPETTKLVVMVGPNGSGKTSFLEAMNHFSLMYGFATWENSKYLYKESNDKGQPQMTWATKAKEIAKIDFYDAEFTELFGQDNVKRCFYFRSAYRNEPDFHIESMRRQEEPFSYVRLSSLMENDQEVSSNYQRLVSSAIKDMFDDENNQKTVQDLRDELTGSLSSAIERIFDDLSLTSLGDPLTNGAFFFSKGITENFHYRNLSAGEKAAFDLILDLVIKSRFYNDAVYCIDEPEAHMHTSLQGRVLREMYSLIPGNSQLWVSTHSIGMLREAEELEKENPGTVVFLDFGGRDYDTDQTIRASQISRALLKKFYELAFGDFAKLILPRTIVFCEGSSKGRTRKDFDANIYTAIFEKDHPDALFISGGSCNDIQNLKENSGGIFEKLLNNTNVVRLIDRDDRSQREIDELRGEGVSVLSMRSLESYLLDDSVIHKLCILHGKESKYKSCIEAKKKALDNVVAMGKPDDDVKSARGEIYNALKKELGLTQCGNDADSFLRDIMAPLITSDMAIYQLLEEGIFGCEH